MTNIHFMKLHTIRIFVDDWETACTFYEDTLQLPIRLKNPDLGWAEFDVGETRLGIERVAADDAEGKQLIGRFLGISFQVDDIEATYHTLMAHGVTFVQPPERQHWGGTLAHFTDSSGNVLTLLG
ncbi:MAG: hypothetical protein NPIRA02_37190 [Nitrospirales bacterium]|nr:MAG: hypothetical protein NPIRA02_37190 [Nitrospirales bacterium]